MTANINFSSTELGTPDGIERVLRRFASAIPQLPKPPSPINPSALAMELAPFLRDQLQFNGIAPLNLQSLLPDISAGVLVGTHAERLSSYNPLNYDVGQLFYETDRTVFYINRIVSGSKVWRWAIGTYSNTLAAIPTDLATNDTGFLFDVTDYDHLLQWTGAAWTWGPDELGSGYYQLFEDAPNTIGANAWALCNGATVDRLNPTATVTPVTVPDVTTARYLKGGITSAAVAGYSGNTPTGTNSAPTFTGTPAGGSVTAAAGGDVTAVAFPYTPAGSVSAPTFTGNAMSTLELPNKQARLYYRR